MRMQTIKLQIEDNTYQDILQKGIDIQARLKEFILDLTQDSYPPISSKEAKKRVSKAVESHQNGTMKTIGHDDAWAQIDHHIESRN